MKLLYKHNFCNKIYFVGSASYIVNGFIIFHVTYLLILSSKLLQICSKMFKINQIRKCRLVVSLVHGFNTSLSKKEYFL